MRVFRPPSCLHAGGKNHFCPLLLPPASIPSAPARLPASSREIKARRPVGSLGRLLFHPCPRDQREEKEERPESRWQRIGGPNVSHGSQTRRKPRQIEHGPGDIREPKRRFGRLLVLEAMTGEGGLVPMKKTRVGHELHSALPPSKHRLPAFRITRSRRGWPRRGRCKMTRVGHE